MRINNLVPILITLTVISSCEQAPQASEDTNYKCPTVWYPEGFSAEGVPPVPNYMGSSEEAADLVQDKNYWLGIIRHGSNADLEALLFAVENKSYGEVKIDKSIINQAKRDLALRKTHKCIDLPGNPYLQTYEGE